MRKILIAGTLIFSILFTSSVYAVDSKLRAIGTMAGYGVVGGALLGTASLAFGAGGRSIAKGASLGLYAGLLFGGYMILSYEYKKRGWGEVKENYYPDSQGPYENPESQMKVPNLENYSLVSLEEKGNKAENKILFFTNFATLSF